MRIAKESIFSEMNNVGVFTILDPFFADKFGFTQTEVQDLLQYFNLEQQSENIKDWYDGYQFGNTTQIYNPWSIMNYVSRNSEGFKTYWVNTGTDSLIKKEILKPDIDDTYTTLERLVAGETICKLITEDFIFSDFDTQRELFWTLLLFSGYLTATKEIRRNEYELRVPNYEVKTVFQDIVVNWLQHDLRIKKELVYLTAQHLVNNRLADFEKGFRKIIGDTFSYFDTKGIPENVYQAYVLGLLAVIGDDYVIKSNRESGEGRYDILLMPHDKTQYGAVIEIKQLPRKKKETKAALTKRINKALTKALGQIEEKEYYKQLEANKISKIIKLPIVFVGKKAYVLTVE